MKLKIKDSGEKTCDVWLEESDDKIHLVWRNEEGSVFYLATLRNDKTIEVITDSGFKEY